MALAAGNVDAAYQKLRVFSQVLTYDGSTAAGYWRHAPLGSAPAAGLSTSVTAPFALAKPTQALTKLISKIALFLNCFKNVLAYLLIRAMEKNLVST